MKREEVLGWLAIVLAIPPIIYLVADGKWAAGIFAVLVIVALLREYISGQRRNDRPTFTLLTVRKRLTFTSDPRIAHFENVIRVRVNHMAESFMNSYIAGDGQIENVKLDGADPDEIYTKGGRTNFRKNFNHQLTPGSEFTITVTYDMVDVFPGETEGISHSVEYETIDFNLEVIFFHERPCLGGEVFKTFGGVKKRDVECQRLNSGQRLSFSLRKPVIGSEYLLEWKWSLAQKPLTIQSYTP